MKKVNAIFMGTPEFSVPVLEMLLDEVNVMLVVTQPDKEVGRHHKKTPSPVKECAMKHGISVFQPEKIRQDYDPILKLNPDIIITCAYGQIIPSAILDCPKLGCINVHASILPFLRGGAPIQHAIIDGLESTGVTIMYMDVKMDTGDIISQKEIPILPEDTAGSLFAKLSLVGRDLLKETLPSIIDQTNQRKTQDESKATYAYNIKREEEHLNFFQTGKEILNKIRGLNPEPYANIIIKEEEMKIISASFTPKENTQPSLISEVTKNTLGIDCQDGVIYLKEVKPFGKKAMQIKDYLNGIQKESLINQKIK